MPNSHDVTLVLLGESGSGKSASGNTILGAKKKKKSVILRKRKKKKGILRKGQKKKGVLSKRKKKEMFSSRASAAPVTTECQVEKTKIQGTKVTVIDTPDLSDEDLQQRDEHVKKCKEMCKGQVCVYLLVIQIGRFTEGERGILERLETALDRNIRDRTIILFTRGDDLEDQPIDNYVRNTDQHLQTLIEECGGRYHVFNNKVSNEHQLIDLMEKIAPLVETDTQELSQCVQCIIA